MQFFAPPATVLRRHAPPLHRLPLGLVGLMGVLLVLAVLAGVERRDALNNAQDRGELIARTLAGQVTRSVDAVSMVLQALGESIVRQQATEPARLQPLLPQGALASLPFLKGVAVLDEHGGVLASTARAELGLRVALDRFGPLPSDGLGALLPWLPARSLADLAHGAPVPRTAGAGLLPLLRSVRGPGGQRLLLLALIEPGALADFTRQTPQDDASVALLASLDGRLMAADDRLAQQPGGALSGPEVFGSWLPARDHGEYIGTGVRPGRQVVAFRALGAWPLVVVVEQAEAVALQPWHERLRWLVGFGLLTLMALAGGLAARLRRSPGCGPDALAARELSVLLKSVQELIFRTDADGAITFVNARWAAISDGGAEQACGRCFASLVAPADRARAQALFRRDDRAGVRQAQVCIPAADGQPRHFQLAVVPLHGEGRIVGFAGSAVDVSERVAADQQLQHQLAFSGLLLEISPQPVAMFDAEGRHVLVNQAWEDFVGRPRAQVIGSLVDHYLPPAEAELHAEQDARLLACGGRLRYEAQVTHRDGSRRDMVVIKVLVPDRQGQSAGILCTLIDVSEFRDAERATRDARDAAEEASRAKSEFIANISHELRTPLQAIIGFSELGCMRGSSAPKLAAMFTDIHRSGQRMLALVNDLLDVSKIESTVGTFELERCDLRTLVQAVLRELEPLLAQRRLRLVLRLSDEPLSAKVDPLRIHQAMRNVIANAIKFSPEGGWVQVEAVATAPDEFTLSVADSGPGIPSAELESIFEAFVQSSKTKDGSGGTGLGLAIARKIIEVHGGHISAENGRGGGAVFRIRLPLRVPGDSQLLSAY